MFHESVEGVLSTYIPGLTLVFFAFLLIYMLDFEGALLVVRAILLRSVVWFYFCLIVECFSIISSVLEYLLCWHTFEQRRWHRLKHLFWSLLI